MTAGAIPDVTCPFCGLVCDDLVVRPTGSQLAVEANGCRIAQSGFERAPAAASPRIGGRVASLPEAAAEAARLLRQARQPLIGGLAADVEGARAAGRLADRCGGVLDHMNSTAAFRNTLVLQDSGWITTTLSEVRNRTDLLVAVGGDIVSRFPRFFERCITNRDTLFGTDRQCEVVFLGRGLPADASLKGVTSRVIACDVPRLHEALGAMRALLAERRLTAAEAGGVPMSTWKDLAERMKAARYGVAAWAAPDFDFPHAELTVQALCELIKDLNRHTRFSGLPLGGSDGDVTADSVALWQTGYGSRTAYGQGAPDHDSYYYATARLLAGGADVLLWISSFNAARTPPATTLPTVVLGREGMTFEREPAVFIPVGTPGLDHAGHLFRTDRVVALPLRQLRESSLPSVAEAIAAIEVALGEAP
jgi:formylmethanofuran dehydrogenase subunit B